MLGTIVNTISIIIGGSVGLGLGKTFSERYSETVLNAISMAVVVLGLSSALKTDNMLLMICSMAIGGVIGELINIEKRLDHFSQFIERKFSSKKGNITEGFTVATLIYCVGAMSIIGAIESGINNNHSTLFAKSVLDGISSIVFASTLGVGVPLSAISVFIYQGAITLLSVFVADFIPQIALNELSAVGGILIAIIGLNVMKLTKIRVGNLLPAIFVPLVYYIVKLNFFA